MRIISLLPVLLLLGAASGHAGEIFKWQENGKTQYGEFPPPGVEAQVFKREVGSVSQTGQTAASPEAGSPDPAPVPQPGDEQTVAEVEKYKQQRQENCAIAKRNLGLLKTGGRHRFKLPDGSVQYLDEEQTRQRIEKAERQVRDFCT
jgi:hypothetical protein